MTVKEFLKGFETIPPEAELEFVQGNIGIVKRLEPELIKATTNPITNKDIIVVCFFPETQNLTIQAESKEQRN